MWHLFCHKLNEISSRIQIGNGDKQFGYINLILLGIHSSNLNNYFNEIKEHLTLATGKVDKKISHHSFHVAKASVKCNCIICKSFNETLLVLLAIKPQDKCFLTGLNDSVCLVYQNAWQNKRFPSYKVVKRTWILYTFSKSVLLFCFC